MNFRLRILFWTPFTLCAACKPITNNAENKGLYQANAIWRNGQANVCFDDNNPGIKNLREKIATIVEQEINFRTRFRFTGFTLCSDNPQADIAVQILSNGRANAEIGSGSQAAQLLSHFIPSQTLRQPMHIFSHWGDGRDINKETFHNIIVHEFGHALGLHHEQLRADNKAGSYCNDKLGEGDPGSQPAGSVAVGPYDVKSIMNYCVDGYFTRELPLSKGDVDAINTMYPNSTAGGNFGYQLRCLQTPLLECAQNQEANSCILRFCAGGPTVCTKPTKLTECLRNKGGNSCLSSSTGNCRIDN